MKVSMFYEFWFRLGLFLLLCNSSQRSVTVGRKRKGNLIHTIRSSPAVVLMRCTWSRERSLEGVKACGDGEYLFVFVILLWFLRVHEWERVRSSYSA